MSIKHILVASDLGEATADALDAAEAMARAFDAKLTLVHAVHTPYLVYGSAPYVPLDDAIPAAQAALDVEFKKLQQRYAKAESLLVRGDPRTRIPELAGELGADLIVIGTHGRRGISHAFLGSVAERIVQTSKVPVLTVRVR